jgi:hypothetical protein
VKFDYRWHQRLLLGSALTSSPPSRVPLAPQSPLTPSSRRGLNVPEGHSQCAHANLCYVSSHRCPLVGSMGSDAGHFRTSDFSVHMLISFGFGAQHICAAGYRHER